MLSFCKIDESIKKNINSHLKYDARYKTLSPTWCQGNPQEFTNMTLAKTPSISGEGA